MRERERWRERMGPAQTCRAHKERGGVDWTLMGPKSGLRKGAVALFLSYVKSKWGRVKGKGDRNPPPKGTWKIKQQNKREMRSERERGGGDKVEGC